MTAPILSKGPTRPELAVAGQGLDMVHALALRSEGIAS